jgi:hypothetical protein
MKTAWALPRQDIAPGVPWHITGSILGLDVAMATAVGPLIPVEAPRP